MFYCWSNANSANSALSTCEHTQQLSTWTNQKHRIHRATPPGPAPSDVQHQGSCYIKTNNSLFQFRAAGLDIDPSRGPWILTWSRIWSQIRQVICSFMLHVENNADCSGCFGILSRCKLNFRKKIPSRKVFVFTFSVFIVFVWRQTSQQVCLL